MARSSRAGKPSTSSKASEGTIVVKPAKAASQSSMGKIATVAPEGTMSREIVQPMVLDGGRACTLEDVVVTVGNKTLGSGTVHWYKLPCWVDFRTHPLLSGHYGTVTLGMLKATGERVAVKAIDKSKYTNLDALREEIRFMRVSAVMSDPGSCCVARGFFTLPPPRCCGTPISFAWWTCLRHLNRFCW